MSTNDTSPIRSLLRIFRDPELSPKVRRLALSEALRMSRDSEGIFDEEVAIAYGAHHLGLPRPGERGRVNLRDTATLHADVLLVTVKKVEEDAARVAFGLHAEHFVTRQENRNIWRFECSVDARKPGFAGIDNRVCLLTCIGDDGNTEAGVILSNILKGVKVRLVVIVGMAAGIKGADWTNVYGVRTVTEADYGTRTSSGVSIEPRPLSVGDREKNALLAFRPHTLGWDPLYRSSASMARKLMESGDFEEHDVKELGGNYKLSYKVRNAFSSDAKVELPPNEFTAWVKGGGGDLAVVDMETFGLARASVAAGLPWVAFRGISDLGEVGRLQDSQFSSALACATLVKSFLSGGYTFPEDDDRTASTF